MSNGEARGSSASEEEICMVAVHRNKCENTSNIRTRTRGHDNGGCASCLGEGSVDSSALSSSEGRGVDTVVAFLDTILLGLGSRGPITLLRFESEFILERGPGGGRNGTVDSPLIPLLLLLILTCIIPPRSGSI